MTREMRDYQSECVAAIYDEWTRVRRTAAVMATGLGKTDVIAKVATNHAREGGRVLILAHRSELLDQIGARCQMHAPEIVPGRVQAQRNETRRGITVAMSSTLAHEKRRNMMLRPTLVVVDECHHAPSPSYMKILEWAGCFEDTPTLGVTATMARGDRRGLGDVWQSVAYERNILWAIENHWLVRPYGRSVVIDHMDLTKAKTSRGDYQDGELGAMVAQDVDQVVKAWRDHADNRITAAFTPNVESAKALTEEFLAQGVPAEAVFGDTPLTERGDAARGTGIYGRLARGETRVMVNVMVGTEGWDCSPVSCILMARPTKLPSLYQQIIGRGLRLSPETGKDSCLVLDVVGASRHQKLVTLVDLSPTAEYNTDEIPPCEDCGQKPCECPKEEKERDPDGGRIRLLGPAKYAEVDLFSRLELNWLSTKGGLRFVKVKDWYAFIVRERNGSFSAWHCVAERGKPYDERVILERTTEEKALRAAEDWVLQKDNDIYRRNSPWRRGGKPSEKQLNWARSLGVTDPESMNKARVSDEIDIALASKRLD